MERADRLCYSQLLSNKVVEQMGVHEAIARSSW